MHGEERAIYVALTVTGAIGAGAEILTSSVIGTRATIALVLFAIGVIGLMRSWLTPAPLPVARIVR